MIDFDKLSDESVITYVRNGSDDALQYIIDKYKNIVKIKARAYFLIGADKDDIIQEGMIGLYKAIKDFDSKKSQFFYPFAELCIVRQMISAIKTALRQKHAPLNEYISFDNEIESLNNDKAYIEIISSSGITNPEDIFIGKEDKSYIEAEIEKMLTPLEKKTLTLFLNGRRYSEIAEILGKNEKSVDNTLQRVRKKVDKILRER